MNTQHPQPIRPHGPPTGVTLEPAGPSFGLRLFLLAVVLAAFAGALFLVFRKGQETSAGGHPPAAAPPVAAAGGTAPPQPSTGKKLTLGVAYGTEKRTWLEWAAQEFAATPEGQHVEVDLIPVGSLEGAQRIWRKDERVHVWSPASALYRDTFVAEWQAQYGSNPIAREEPLALSPMVFVMWEERYKAFTGKYNGVTFKAVGQALAEPTGWVAIANKPDWTFFKFSHTHPNESNSGLMTLVLLAYDFLGKADRLTGADLTSAEFQRFFEQVETGVVAPAGRLVNSTGNLMDDMVRKGPSTYDAVFVYENVAIDQLRKAEGRWKDRLRVVYPKYNMWNDNPYYVLDVPWSRPEHRRAAEQFLRFLLSDRVQARAMDHGFRPANTNVPTAGGDSPFVKFKDQGLSLDLQGTICTAPRAEVINALLQRWQQVRGTR